MGPEIPNGISDGSKTNVFHYDNSRSVDKEKASLDNDSKAEKGFENDQELEEVANWEHRIFSDEKKLSSTDTEREESEIDEGLRNAINSIVKMDSNTSKEKSLTAEINSSSNPEESCEANETLVLQFNTDCQSSADDSQQPRKIESRRSSPILGNKRKLRPRKIIESDEFDEVTKKRSRREPRNKSGSLSANTSLADVAREKSIKNYSRKIGNNSLDNDELVPEDLADVNTARKASTNEEEMQSLISARIAYHNKILKILNEGSIAELKLLPRIGPKGAMMIYRHREIHGKLRSIKDLKNMKGWSPKFFEQFLQANAIDLD